MHIFFIFRKFVQDNYAWSKPFKKSFSFYQKIFFLSLSKDSLSIFGLQYLSFNNTSIPRNAKRSTVSGKKSNILRRILSLITISKTHVRLSV